MERSRASRAVGMLAGALLALSALAVAAAEPSSPPPGSPGVSAPASSPEGAPSESPAASAAPAVVLISCGRGAYPGLGIDAPADAAGFDTPEGEALRASLRRYEDDFADTSDWRIAGRTESEVLFIGRSGDAEPPQFAYILMERTDEGWQPRNWGGCDPRIVISPEIGSADWWLDPAAGPPTTATTELPVLVIERACASGASAEGRIAEPVIVTSPTTVTITIGVMPRRDGDQTCQDNLPTPFTVLLPEPLGARQLLDGGHAPPIPPTQPEGLEGDEPE